MPAGANPPLVLGWSRAQIAARVGELAEKIGSDYGSRQLLAVALLKGGTVFLADLVRAMDRPVEVDFLAVRALGRHRSADAQPVALNKDLDVDIGGRDVLLVADVADSGVTLAYLLRALATRRPASLATAVLLDRRARRVTALNPRYVAFTVGPELYVGYGLDLHGSFRNCPDLWRVVDEGAVRANPVAALAITATARDDASAPAGGGLIAGRDSPAPLAGGSAPADAGGD